MEDIFGTKYTSRLRSLVYWRWRTNNFKLVEEKTGQKFPGRYTFISKVGDGVCPLCDGAETVIRPNGVKVFCLCYLLDHIQVVEQRIGNFRSYASAADFREAQPWGDARARTTLRDMVELSRRFVSDPRKWLLLSGNPGSGKTHMLRAMAHEFGPFAFYISAADFEQLVFRSMEEKVLQDVIHGIERAPILLFDDWGAEYGSDFVDAKFRQIIDFRYQLWPEYPVALTTNMSGQRMAQVDPRVNSRLNDGDRSTVFFAGNKIGDYRQRGNQ